MRREARSKIFSYLTRNEAMELALEAPVDHPQVNNGVVPGNHISEITINSDDGQRYVFGLPLYNLFQRDVEFSVDGIDATYPADPVGGQIQYAAGDNSTENDKGKEHLYTCSTTPAYAHSFLLTARVSSDYSDVDAVRGPSDGDLGNYTRFTYCEPIIRSWRTPVSDQANRARFAKGQGATNMDDKASYVYGEKEVRYLKTIESRNMVAVFRTLGRFDDQCIGENGVSVAGNSAQQLDRIDLYEKKSYQALGDAAVPIKSVHFDYGYDLCPGTPTSAASGKLTLKKLWFTYGPSNLGVSTPYVFEYGTDAMNPRYDANAQDRWGGLKANYITSGGDPENAFAVDVGYLTNQANSYDAGHLRTSEFPYAVQDPALADVLASAWSLKTITLPSGGKITINYEADDYATVQDRPAMRMFRICGVGNHSLTKYEVGGGTEEESKDIDGEEDLFLYFKIPSDLPVLDKAVFEKVLFQGIEDLYYRAEVKTVGGEFDFISGYASHGEGGSGIESYGVNEAGYGWVKLRAIPLDGDDENGTPKRNPIYRSALEYIQANYADKVFATFSVDDVEEPSAAQLGEDFFTALASSVFGLVTGLGSFFTGPNMEMANKSAGYCKQLKTQRSWIRLNEPDHNKKGGGHRVRSISFSDEWGSMEPQESARAASYGQEYHYTEANGASCGVAAYEPMVGADENPWRRPSYNTRSRTLSPDERFYQEEPFGESLFPGAAVGYSKVVVTDTYPTQVQREAQGRGSTVHEFYTAADFPTRTARTRLAAERRRNDVDLLALLGFRQVDNMHVSQGFTVETNDMHGKPKKVTTWPEPKPGTAVELLPTSIVEYTYSTSGPGGASELRNSATVITPDGNIGRAEIGRQYEFTADMREYATDNASAGVGLNVEVLWAFLAGIPVPVTIPKFSSSKVRFRSGTLVKKVHRFGLLTKVTKTENGSKVSTENLAYDALTGAVLLTRTVNGFDDPVFTMRFPAYWHYDGMGPAYLNIGSRAALAITGGHGAVADAREKFFPGDLLAMQPDGGGAMVKGWVNDVGPGSVEVIDRFGVPVDGTYNVRVVRSGRRNMQAADMMNLTTLSDPLQGMAGNVYASVLDAKSTVYSDDWQTECACLDEGLAGSFSNPWLLDRRGVWRVKKENLRVTGRNRSWDNGNSDVRRDGTYTGFSPNFRLVNGQWMQDDAGWTTVREVKQYGVRGQELENMDALQIFSSSTFGYRGNLPKTVAKNARYQEAGFDGFEESMPADCADRHFRFNVPANAITMSFAHTGRKSLKVVQGGPVQFTNVVWDCQQDPCADFQVAVQNQQGSWLVTAQNGTPPYTVVPMAFEGDPCTFTPMVNGLTIWCASSNWSGQVHVEDANGCSINATVEP
jgi:hypothetical protein